MAPKVKDIAGMLGVSPATVSLVLNNRPGVSQATRQRVIQAFRELGGESALPVAEEKRNVLFLVYHKSLATQGSSYFSQLFADIIHGVDNQARALGYNLMVSYTDRHSLREQAENIDSAGVHGVLLLATDMAEEQIVPFENLRAPLVIIDNYWDHKSLDCVTINNAHGVFQAVKHLADMGHSRIGYLHILKNANNFNERHDAFFRAVTHYGLESGPDWTYGIDTRMGGEEVYREISRVLDQQPHMPTALFADNDILVVYALRVLRERGVRVPQDVSIVGFDNMSMTEMLDPPLTTIRPDKYRIGVTSFNTLVEKIREPDQFRCATKVAVGTQLVERRSVKRMEATK